MKSTKERIKSKDKIDSFDQAICDEYDVRTRRIKAIQRNLYKLEEEHDLSAKTPVFKAKASPISSWLGSVSNEQDMRPVVHSKQSAAKAYQSLKEANEN